MGANPPPPRKVSKVFKAGGLGLDLSMQKVAPFLGQPLMVEQLREYKCGDSGFARMTNYW